MFVTGVGSLKERYFVVIWIWFWKWELWRKNTGFGGLWDERGGVVFGKYVRLGVLIWSRTRSRLIHRRQDKAGFTGSGSPKG